MASAKQKAWRKKFARLYGGKKKKRSTTKGQKRKTARRAYVGLKKKKSRKRKSNKSQKKRSPRMAKKSWSDRLKTGTTKKVLIGLGAAQLAGLITSLVAPQFTMWAKPITALAAGGVPGVAAELVVDQGLLGNIMGMFGMNRGGINAERLAGGL